ncbi:MAG TPA: glucoamylase family protein [Chitinophagaceae bacterium]|nr:glucoamylase family protein [Chitinophagaceae bacterium]
MKVTTNTIDEFLTVLRAYFQKNSTRKYADEKPPLRSELFTRGQLEQHAKFLAGVHELSYEQAPEQLVKRLSENEEVLSKVTSLLHDAVKEKNRISPAGEWLLDNYYLIEEQIATGKRHLPKKYSKGLPQLVSGPLSGFPRVYDIAIEIISHSDGHMDMDSLTAFITSYQKVKYLTIGELWAVPIMLRLALLENLRRVAARIAIDRIDERTANYWAEKIIASAEKDPKSLILVIADMARSNPPMVSAFVAPLTRRLQWKGSEFSLALTWLEQHLAEKSLTINDMVQAENQKQAADQVSMSNSINSLRFLAKMDWREFVEAMSVIEQTLREDYSGIYPQMDFYTRDSYRHVVEKIAKKINVPEHDVARIAVNLAKDSAVKNPEDMRRAHVGYYLVGKGITQTETAVNLKLDNTDSFKKIIARHNTGIYITGALLITLAVGFGLFAKTYANTHTVWLLIVVSLLGLLCASHLALAIANWVATLLIKPRQLPRMNFSTGIPVYARTMVVVPAIVSDISQAETLVEELEVRFLANRDDNLFFGLLTDFKDAPEKTLSTDAALEDHLKKGIENLNKKYGRSVNDVFFLFHRPRQWNPREKIWMGYERKRGKLGELNHLLRGGPKNRFSTIIGEDSVYSTIKYIITLDADTQLPRDSAWKLAGIMAHPLNHALYSERKKRIIDGYGIVQPRIAISLHGAVRSLYTRMHESDSGIDPYTRVTSDVYQDLFAEGSFIGKGIYEVDVFEKVLNDRFPENRILSHDLLEGAYTRCALASDVQLYEEYPSSYIIDINRRHRWIRGDWQIGNWFLPFVPDMNRKLQKNAITALSRWKIFDNLRRSLVPVALLVLLVLGWTILPAPWFWTVSVIGIIILPSLLSSAWDIIRKPDDVLLKQHIKNSFRSTSAHLIQSIFTLVCLPYEAYISLDAIMRTAWRLIITRRHLLEWNPSSFATKSKKHANLFFVYKTMWFAPFIALAILVYITNYFPITLIVAVPFIISWSLSPAVVWLLSKPMLPVKTRLNDRQIVYLRKLARKTWGFFENFVTEEDNWLPPDNHQNHPIAVTAHRTSPTNMGMALLANLAAHDFGYISTEQLIENTGNTLTSMNMLEKYCGHFYNWYDTLTLKTLHPRYISTVDSGNLAGHLLTLRQGLFEIPQQKVLDKKRLNGLLDTVRVVGEKGGSKISAWSELEAQIEATAAATITPFEYKRFFETIITKCTTILHEVKADRKSDLYWWICSLEGQLKHTLEEINKVAPWLETTNIPEKFLQLPGISSIPSMYDIACGKIDKEINNFLAGEVTPGEREWLEEFKHSIGISAKLIRERISTLNILATKCFDMAEEMKYDFLYDKSQHLLAIGYNVEEHRRDAGFYDLLASEARLCSFVAIAQGKIPQESWFALGRRLNTAAGIPVLLSWSGSMFEYLMPNLVMPSYESTLIDQTNRGVVKRQMEYGRQNNIPWGISESCYNMVDASLNYQYRAFGVPGLGFKRGLGDDLVIAPYATMLSLMVDPEAACNNLEKLSSLGFENKFGFYESIDYTPARLPRGQSHMLIQTFMVHHQGMGLLALNYLLLDQPMQKRFEAEPQFQATLLLLQEQIPKTTGVFSLATETSTVTAPSGAAEMRIIKTPATPVPEVQLLSNGRYHVVVTNAGGGYSRWKSNAVTRWREDSTCDNWGMFCYIRDLDSGDFWSTAHQPVQKEAKFYEAVFSQGRAEFRRRDNDIETHTEIIVSPEDDIEIRRVQLTNRSGKKKRIDITSYAEVVMTSPAAEAAHPAFSNLFIQTDILPKQHAIVCTRRARSHDEQPPLMFHLVNVNGVSVKDISYETDRDKFVGRGNTPANPAALKGTGPLSGSKGSVLDPIVAIRYSIVLDDDDVACIDMITGMTENKDQCRLLIDKYQDKHLRDRAFELSWTHSQVVLRQINASESDAQLYGRLAGSVVYANPLLRASPGILAKNNRGQSSLWSYSISGDLPIVLLQVTNPENISLVKQMVQAHAYWNLKGLKVDLVIWNDDHTGYRQVLQEQILGIINAGAGYNSTDNNSGRIFVRPVDQISIEDRVLLQTVARIIISDDKGTLYDQVVKHSQPKGAIPYITPATLPQETGGLSSPGGLIFHNGFGGFTEDGKEYIITTSRGKNTPAPWVNVIANPRFGTVISESGSAYSWNENAHEFRLTPWNNDAVSDTGGEAFYLRDERDGQFWSPMSYPKPGKTPYITRHGFGYSVFEHNENGIFSQTTVFTDVELAVKYITIRVANRSGRQRKLSATGYMEWVLGDLRPKSLMHVVTEIDGDTNVLFSRNCYNTEFSSRIAFFDTDDPNKTFTTDRNEFIGRNGSLQNPDGMRRVRLSGRYGAGFDPCTALQVTFDLEDKSEKTVVFRLGAAKDTLKARKLVNELRATSAEQALQKIYDYWNRLLTAIHIDTPDKALNVLANGWLLYQVISCRLWGRSGFYQSGGAFGFRDQLQDVMAVIHADPRLTRRQILLAASRQFKEGDAQHWWHPPLGRGVRTHCSDDFLWLPFVLAKYITATGDRQILDEEIKYLEGRPVNANEESYYDLPNISDKTMSLYEHAKRAVQHGLRFGSHGLPLIGAGDWNDGMNMVGKDGKGESVWLAFFLYEVLQGFRSIAILHNDDAFAEECKEQAETLRKNINTNAWDGNWYMRAFFDDGTPLGSNRNDECKIDSISQSWSVISGAGKEDRVDSALTSLDKYLVKRNEKIIQLLEPPFDKSSLEPGYIKGYLPGVRENGGQYTHAAVWAVMAFAKAGDRQKAWELLQLINPVNHGSNADEIAVYKTEPYVMAGDVYGVAPHTGRGGWTWYTGSAGWMYQLIIEWLLGLKKHENILHFEPCLPPGWSGFTVQYRCGSTIYHIKVTSGAEDAMQILVDGAEQPDKTIHLKDDRFEHTVEIKINPDSVHSYTFTGELEEKQH